MTIPDPTPDTPTRDTSHLHTPQARAARAASRSLANRKPRRTTRPGSETTELVPGNPVRIHGSGVSSPYKGRSGWVATVNTQTFDNGHPPYTEIGVTFAIANDWKKVEADAWFRTDELEPA